MHVYPVRTRIFLEKEELCLFVAKYAGDLKEGDVVVVASKIVSLSEGRVVDMPNEDTKESFIREEADFAIKTKQVWLTVKDGMCMSSSGIDESNGNGKLLLLPKNSYASAEKVRRFLQTRFNLSALGVIVVDSCPLPFRRGVVGMALGYSGFCGVRSYAGKKDIFGRDFTYTSVNFADSLATAAAITMGEGDECCPIAIIRDAEVVFTSQTNPEEIRIARDVDMYGPLFDAFEQKE